MKRNFESRERNFPSPATAWTLRVHLNYMVVLIRMKSNCIYFVFSLCFSSITHLEAFFMPDITGWASSLASSVSDGWNGLRNRGCKVIECCDKHWSEEDFVELERQLEEDVYGQNIMRDIVIPSLKGHLGKGRSDGGGKALAMSFHGRPGIGKNYVANKIQEVLFHKKTSDKSKYVHFFSGRIHFPLESETRLYQRNLVNSIRESVKSCKYSVFVFDEVDKMPPKVLDIIKPFLDYHDLIDGIDFRKSIFIFLSNTGGDLIAKEYLKYWQAGKKRENLRLRHFEDLVRIGAFHEKGGFYKSENIESSLIDHYIPFLPLEVEHVTGCIKYEFRKRGMIQPGSELVKDVLNDLTFGPSEQPIFSNSGCKRISSKVSTLVELYRGGRFKPDEL